MKTILAAAPLILASLAGLPALAQTPTPPTTTAPAAAKGEDAAHDAKMAWWREAKFGMFIHWGLYSVPAGAWPGKGTHHAEWIRDTANIPVGEYEKLLPKFNPVKFNAQEWAALAQEAGMRYLVITSKHHDGFCLFDSKETDWDVMSTPFKRDIMKELSDACHRLGPGQKDGGPLYPVRFCMYHSIMDWHHPDYTPRRPWEKADRPAEGADFDRFVKYLKAQLAELCAPKYDPGLIWFDGEWEGTWTHERAVDLAAYMDKTAPGVIYNNRIDKGRAGMEGTTARGFLGDYHTPEQTIPEKGLPGDWETCMTMNGNWGYNAADKNFKSTTDLVQKLCDIASKGGNFLLNVGPTAEGEIPAESVQRLKEMGAWMRVNGRAIYGTQRSPLDAAPAWGRVTMKAGSKAGETTLYLFVFDMPKDGVLAVPGLLNTPLSAHLLQAQKSSVIPQVTAKQADGQVLVDVSQLGAGALTGTAPVPVIELTIAGVPDVSIPPVIDAFADQFVGTTDFTITTPMKGVEIRYTGDGKDPGVEARKYDGPVNITKGMTVSARLFRDGRAVSPVVRRTFVQAPPKASVVLDKVEPGLNFACYKGSFDKVPDFAALKPEKTAVLSVISTKEACSDDNYALRYTGYINVPKTDVYVFHLSSDDGSRLYIGSTLVVDNDGLHSLAEKSGTVVLAGGWHPITVEMFEKSGGADLGLTISTASARRKAPDPGQFGHAP
jgi:alpha-L-fucosidase